MRQLLFVNGEERKDISHFVKEAKCVYILTLSLKVHSHAQFDSGYI